MNAFDFALLAGDAIWTELLRQYGSVSLSNGPFGVSRAESAIAFDRREREGVLDLNHLKGEIPVSVRSRNQISRGTAPLSLACCQLLLNLETKLLDRALAVMRPSNWRLLATTEVRAALVGSARLPTGHPRHLLKLLPVDSQ